MTASLADGVYFGMSFEDYLALERISSSDLTRMMEGPAAWWAQSWLNPDREERDSTAAMIAGAAYHCARLEPEMFEERYCRQIVPDDFQDPTGEVQLLTNGTQIGELLATLGHVRKRSGESVSDQAARLADALRDPPDGLGPVYIWIHELAKWEVNVRGNRTPIDPKTWDEIQRDADRFRMNPEVVDLVSGGAAEVSILWTDQATGLPMKCRPDYLSASRVVHLKTWDQKTAGKPGNRAILDNFQWSGHARTAWLYQQALEEVRVGSLAVIEPGAMGRREADKMIAGIRARRQPVETWFVYQRRGGVPDIRARRVKFFALPPGVTAQMIEASTESFPIGPTRLGVKASLEVESCLSEIRDGLEINGPSRVWFPRDIIGEIEDDDFSDYWLEARDRPR